MSVSIGIVKETKSFWERRTPLVPTDVKSLISNYPLKIFVQPSERRIFSNEEYADLGKLAHSHDFSGRDVDTICKKLMADAFRWDKLGDVWKLKGDYDAQLDMIDQINHEITFAHVKAESAGKSGERMIKIAVVK